MSIRAQAVAIVRLTSVLVLLLAAPASASCAPPVPLPQALETADLVVVGMVTSTRSNDRIATVTVEDVWKGNSEPVMEVAGGPATANSATSVDRTYQAGTRYLFFIFEPAAHGSPGTFGARYEDNNCSDTRPYDASLDTLRPASAHHFTAPTTPAPAVPVPPAEKAVDLRIVLIGSLLALVAAGTIALVARRRNASTAAV